MSQYALAAVAAIKEAHGWLRLAKNMSCFAGASAKITPAQRCYEPFLHALARAFPGVFCCLVATRQGEVLARLPLETQHPKNPHFDETEFDDIPAHGGVFIKARWQRFLDAGINAPRTHSRRAPRGPCRARGCDV